MNGFVYWQMPVLLYRIFWQFANKWYPCLFSHLLIPVVLFVFLFGERLWSNLVHSFRCHGKEHAIEPNEIANKLANSLKQKNTVSGGRERISSRWLQNLCSAIYFPMHFSSATDPASSIQHPALNIQSCFIPMKNAQQWNPESYSLAIPIDISLLCVMATAQKPIILFSNGFTELMKNVICSKNHFSI